MNFSAKGRTRIEVMQVLEKSMSEFLSKYLKPIEENWQPSDYLPDTTSDHFMEEMREIQGQCKEMSHDLFAVLIGDTITEEALPTYESWLMGLEGLDQYNHSGWTKWVRAWTAEENRHGDVLNKYLYLSGRVNMREMEVTTQHLINDGFDIQTGGDPYRNFVYTSFQEMATNVSHRRVATQAKQSGNHLLAKMCGVIASDEARHARAYMEFIRRIFELDPSEMMLAFGDMMKKKIVMPAHFMRETGGSIGSLFGYFSDAAQRAKVYTTEDYIEILSMLIKEWDIANIKSLNESAEKTRDYLMKLPDRLIRIAERSIIPEKQYEFKWLNYNL
ncbi:MAG: acyl-ACP desaturase [Lutimonas sp.]